MTKKDTGTHLKMVVSAHPGLILKGEERETFASECGDLAAIADAHARDAELLVYCAWAARKQARFDDAFAFADRAIAVDRSSQTLSAKASVHRARGEADEAAALFGEAATKDPEDTSALMEAARTFGEAGRFGDAARWFGRVVERDPEHAEAMAWREYAAYCDDKDDKHVAALENLVNKGGNDGTAEELLESIENER